MDEVRLEANPGLFGWIEANRKQNGHWVRDVSILVMVIGPRRLKGADCIIQINDRSFHFANNPGHTWEIRAPLAEGEHKVIVSVGDVVRKLTVNVWRQM